MPKNLPRTYRFTLQLDVEIGDVTPEHVSDVFRVPPVLPGRRRGGKQPALRELPSRLLPHIVGDDEARTAFVKAVMFDIIRHRSDILLDFLNDSPQVGSNEAILRQTFGALIHSNDSIDALWDRLIELAPLEANLLRQAHEKQIFGLVGPLEPLKLGVQVQPVQTLIEEVE